MRSTLLINLSTSVISMVCQRKPAGLRPAQSNFAIGIEKVKECVGVAFLTSHIIHSIITAFEMAITANYG